MNFFLTKFYQNKFYIFFSLIFFVLIIRLLQHHPFLEIDPWLYSHYLFNYNDLGFVKRGLISSIFDINPNNYKIKSNIFSWLILFFTCYQITLLINDTSPKLKKTIFLFFISGFAVQNLSFDFGRFDIIGVLVFLLFINYNQYSKIIISLAPILLFVHEVQLFMILSFLGFNYFVEKKYNFDKYLIFFIFQIFFYLSILFFYGKYQGDMDNYEQYFAIINYFGSDVILATLNNTILTTLNTMTDPINIILRYPALILTILMIFITAKFFLSNHNKKLFYFYCSICLFYLILFIIGGDYSRWLSIFFIMNTLSILFLLKAKILILSEKYFIKYEKGINYFLILFIFTGPVGVGHFLDIPLRYTYRMYQYLGF